MWGFGVDIDITHGIALTGSLLFLISFMPTPGAIGLGEGIFYLLFREYISRHLLGVIIFFWRFFHQFSQQARIPAVDIFPKMDRAVGRNPGRPVQQVHRDRFGQSDRLFPAIVHGGYDFITGPGRVVSQKVLGQLDRFLYADTSAA